MNGLQRTYTVPANWTGDLVDDATSGTGTLDLASLAPQAGFGSVATATEDVDFDAASVVRMDVNLNGSAALDDVSWCTGAGQARAGVLLRNGSGVNASILTNASMPVIGGTWTANLDCTALGNGIATLSIRSTAIPGRMTPFGEELIDGSLVHRTMRVFSGTASALSWAIPADPALIGRSVHAQGFCKSTTGTGSKVLGRRGALSNALDLTLGY